MNLIESIEKLIKRAGRHRLPDEKETAENSKEENSVEASKRLQDILDGMGTGTARIIIDRKRAVVLLNLTALKDCKIKEGTMSPGSSGRTAVLSTNYW